MADHNKPVLTSTYANFVSELDARFDDLSLGLDPAVTSATNLPVNTIRWNSALAKDQKWNGSTWADKSSFYVLGSVRFNNGTVGAPSITFSDDTTTGVFKPTAQSIALTIAGVEVLRTIDGNLLVGTESNSGGRVRIKGGTQPLVFDATGAGGQLVGPEWRASDNSLRAYIKDNTESAAGGEFRIATNVSQSYLVLATGNNAERARITATGNLMLGIASDTGRRLEVSGDGKISGRLDVTGRIIAAGATGNDYGTAALSTEGGGTGSPTIKPVVGFHQPGLYAGSIQLISSNNFAFHQADGTTLAGLSVGNLLVGVATYTPTPITGLTVNPSSETAVNIGHDSSAASGSAYLNFAYNGSGIGSLRQNGTTGITLNGGSNLALSATTVTAPTVSTSDNSTAIATTAFVKNQLYATLDNPTLTGNPTAPTVSTSDNSTAIATTSYVTSKIPSALNASGSAPLYACRAWVNFNGTGTVAIRASGNVSSVTDNGVGNYTVNFITPMQDVNYASPVSGGPVLSSNGYLYGTGTKTISSVTISVREAVAGVVDSTEINVAIFR